MEPIASSYLFSVSVVVYYQPDKGNRKIDYIVGPFESDKAATVWMLDHKDYISKKGSYELELTLTPNEDYYENRT